MQADHHTLVLLVRPPDAPELTDEQAATLQDAHLAHQADLHDKGHVIAAGPLVGQDDERLRGIAVLSVDPETGWASPPRLAAAPTAPAPAGASPGSGDSQAPPL